jgi:hypothetical protein
MQGFGEFDVKRHISANSTRFRSLEVKIYSLAPDITVYYFKYSSSYIWMANTPISSVSSTSRTISTRFSRKASERRQPYIFTPIRAYNCQKIVCAPEIAVVLLTRAEIIRF